MTGRRGLFTIGVTTSRLYDYGLLLGGSLAAGVIGAAFNQLTVTLCPEYFVLAKGAELSALRLSAAVVGFRSALPLGAATIGIALLLRRRTLRVPLWTFAAAMPIAYGLVAAPLALIAYAGYPQLAGAGQLSQAALTRFRLCWVLHLSAYLSALLSWIAMLVQSQVVCRRRTPRARSRQ